MMKARFFFGVIPTLNRLGLDIIALSVVIKVCLPFNFFQVSQLFLDATAMNLLRLQPICDKLQL